MPDDSVRFGPIAAGQIKAVVRRVMGETYPTNGQNQRYPIMGAAGSGMYEAILSTTLPPFNSSTNTYGQGNAVIYCPTLNGNTNTYTASKDLSYNNANGVVVLNFSVNSGTLNANTHIGIFSRYATNGGLIFELAWADC